MSTDEFAVLADAAKILTDSGHYRVLRRFQPRTQYAEEDGAEKLTAVFVDIETTGKEQAVARIIEFAGIPFEYAPDSGKIYTVGEPVSFLEDPGQAIPEDVVELTGLTDDDVRGQTIDERAVEALLAPASLIVAHNAQYDRPLIEQRLPRLETKPWACSMAQVPWRRFGARSVRLDDLLMARFGEFFNGHRAAIDCAVGIHLLAMPTATGDVPFALLRTAARSKTFRVWAYGSPFDAKDVLRRRGYQWHPGDHRRQKSWFIDLNLAETNGECDWLQAEIYAGDATRHRIEELDARTRYSARV